MGALWLLSSSGTYTHPHPLLPDRDVHTHTLHPPRSGTYTHPPPPLPERDIHTPPPPPQAGHTHTHLITDFEQPAVGQLPATSCSPAPSYSPTPSCSPAPIPLPGGRIRVLMRSACVENGVEPGLRMRSEWQTATRERSAAQSPSHTHPLATQTLITR